MWRSQIDCCIGRLEQYGTFRHFVGFDRHVHGVVVTDFATKPIEVCVRKQRQVRIFHRGTSCFAEGTSKEIDTRSFAEGGTKARKVGIRQRSLCCRPRFGGNGLEGRHHAVVNVAHSDAIASVVIPNGKHTPLDRRVALFKLLVADLGRRPMLVEEGAVEIVVIITGCWDDVDIAIRDRHHLEALFLHLLGIGIAIVPHFEQNVLRFHRSFAVSVGECAPSHGLFAIAFHVFDEVVGERTEEFHHFFVLVAVFVSADVHAFTHKYGIFTSAIFGEKTV